MNLKQTKALWLALIIYGRLREAQLPGDMRKMPGVDIDRIHKIREKK